MLEFKVELFEKGLDGCRPQSENCRYVRMEFPKFTGGVEPGALSVLNQRVNDFLFKATLEQRPQDPEALSQEIFRENKKFKKEFPGASSVWTLERNVQAQQLNPHLLALKMSEFTFFGGAHPNTIDVYLNLDPKTGKAYHLKDLFKPGFEKNLTATAERIFREDRKLSPEADLEEAGFFFKEGRFYLNDNFLITPQGITFLFNPYEVAPYVMGPIEVQIPLKALHSLIKPDGPLAALAKAQ